MQNVNDKFFFIETFLTNVDTYIILIKAIGI